MGLWTLWAASSGKINYSGFTVHLVEEMLIRGLCQITCFRREASIVINGCNAKQRAIH
ncbi:hypothetical protein [Brachyspira hyodysenteriae]|uniref:hypothetical protein n=1 Tax=Brachyspira hyodysenteriae TaxID=159 RepID=UPI0022CE1A00|nr:hypothetical protein [Brachyspira hyodysenteriae]MDA0081944.1 hypothetical protein [Brachyspira hyodysenteriae]